MRRPGYLAIVSSYPCRVWYRLATSRPYVVRGVDSRAAVASMEDGRESSTVVIGF